MIPWLNRVVVVVLIAVAVRWLLKPTDRHDRARSGLAPTIGGDTWPPVPVNPVRKS